MGNQKKSIAFGWQTWWLKIWPPNFLGHAPKTFNQLSKKFNHLMDHGLISTIDLVIDFF
jgi:hypothetical protein